MNKKTKWILIIVGILVVALVVMSQMGMFGKEEGTKVTAEKSTASYHYRSSECQWKDLS